MISFRNVGRSFPVAGGKSDVLPRITLDIAAGDFVTVMGVARGTVSATLRAAYRTLGVALRDTDQTNDDETHDDEQQLEHERSG